MGRREVVKSFKVMAMAGGATPGPPLGPALGGNGVNPGQFCQQFNAATQDKKGTVVGCIITVFSDRTFEFVVKTPPVSELLKKAAGVQKGSGTPQARDGGKVSRVQMRKIAEEKMVDLNAASLEAAERMIEGTARSMGIVVEG